MRALVARLLELCGRGADAGCRHVVDEVRASWQPGTSGEPDLSEAYLAELRARWAAYLAGRRS